MINKDVVKVFYGYRGGFRGTSPPWPYIGVGRGGLPRCWYDFKLPNAYYPSLEEEKAILKNQAQMLRQWLEEVEKRINDMEDKE